MSGPDIGNCRTSLFFSGPDKTHDIQPRLFFPRNKHVYPAQTLAKTNVLPRPIIEEEQAYT